MTFQDSRDQKNTTSFLCLHVTKFRTLCFVLFEEQESREKYDDHHMIIDVSYSYDRHQMTPSRYRAKQLLQDEDLIRLIHSIFEVGTQYSIAAFVS